MLTDSTSQSFGPGRLIIPSYMRRAPKVTEVLPILYLRGLSTGDFQAALPVLLGEDAAGLSPTTITRLTASWDTEYHAWRTRRLAWPPAASTVNVVVSSRRRAQNDSFTHECLRSRTYRKHDSA